MATAIGGFNPIISAGRCRSYFDVVRLMARACVELKRERAFCARLFEQSSPTPGSRHCEPCLATTREPTNRLAITDTTAPAPGQKSTGRLGRHPRRARPARTSTGIPTGSISRSSMQTTTDAQRTSTAAAGATRGMAPDGAPRQLGSSRAQQTAPPPTDMPVAPAPPWAGAAARRLSAAY